MPDAANTTHDTDARPPALDVDTELDRQRDTLVRLGYPAIAGLSEAELDADIDDLRVALSAVAGSRVEPPTPGRVPFVLVVPATLAPATATMPLTTLRGRAGFISRDTTDIAKFVAIPSVEVPSRRVYALVDVVRGEEYCNVRPKDALVEIEAAGRTPLTYDEGIALLTLFPETLEKNRCYSLAGSRCGDKRVPALWISDRRPKLGWCWDGNPHTWLGSAHTGGRV